MKLITTLFILFFLIPGCTAQKHSAENQKAQDTAAITPPEVPELKQTHKPKRSSNSFMIRDTTNNKVGAEKKEKSKAKALHANWNRLLNAYVSDLGNVDYQGFIKEKNALTTYLNTLSNTPPKEQWTYEQKLAYWINAYNAFTVKLIIDNFPIKSIKDIENPWDRPFIKIGKKQLSLNDIEHNILRKMGEARIHFAINCASVSCPKLLNQAYNPAAIETQLTEVTQGFLTDNSRNKITQNSLMLSKVFKWFKEDFTKNESLIDFLNQYTKVDVKSDAKTSYLPYDWSLNN